MRHALHRYARATLVGSAALLGALCAALPAAAADAAAQERIIESLAPAERQAYVQRLVARQRARAAPSLDIDVTGPVLTGFNAPTTLDLDKAAAPFKLVVKATDDLSGVNSMVLYAWGPQGLSAQPVILSASSPPLKSFSVAGGIGIANPMLEPGPWKFSWGYGYDGASNYSYFDEAVLDALGNTTFTVVNNGGYDVVAPTLTEGVVQTPSVSLSSVVPGTTSKPPWLRLKVSAADTGNSARAGVSGVRATFCKVAEPSVCLDTVGVTFATGQANVSLYVGAQLAVTNSTGTYDLKTVDVYDHAGNYNYYTSTAFGGTTDFSAYFPGGTTIKIKP
ncbi:MAG: hypothetical protein IPG91_15055 [Ideonella sp.]|nr:hypothetical protein [Ideonella sp.]